MPAWSAQGKLYLHYVNKTGNVQINVTSRCVRTTIVAVESKKYYIFWVCVCSLGNHHEMRMRLIVIFGVSGTIIFFHIIS